MDLEKIAKEIRDILNEKRNELQLEFFEENHIYKMLDIEGNLRTDFPSVSTVYKKFYTPFDTVGQSLKTAKGDVNKQQQLLKEWEESGLFSTNLGSRVHFLLEKEAIKRNGDYKEVRQPIFDVGEVQIERGDNMVIAGNKFLDSMYERKCVLLDTELVLGCNILGYVGQADKGWLVIGKNGKLGIVITDWKTNKKKNFEKQWYTKKMLPPFQMYDDTSLSHYYIQLPLYSRLLISMLKGTKYEDISLLGNIIVLLLDDGTYEEYRVPSYVLNTVMNMDLSKIITR